MSQHEDKDDLSSALAQAIEGDDVVKEDEDTSPLENSLDSTGCWERQGTGTWAKQEEEKKEFDEFAIDFSDELAEEPAPAVISRSPKPAKQNSKANKKAAPSAKSAGAAFAGLSLELDGAAPEPAPAPAQKKKAKPSLAVESDDSLDAADDEDGDDEVDLSAAFGGGGVKKKVKRKRSKPKKSAQPGAQAPVKSSEPAKAAEPEPAAEKIIIYDAEEKKEELKKLIFCALGGSVIGALVWAGMMFATVGFGGRLSLLALAFFSAFGARLGADQVRGRKVRLIAGLSAMLSTVLAKFFLVVLISITFSQFTENDLLEFTDPGAANEGYNEQQMENYQEYLDTGDDGYEDSQYLDEDGEYYEGDEVEESIAEVQKAPPTALNFLQILLSLFSIFDLPFMIVAAVVAGRLAVDSS